MKVFGLALVALLAAASGFAVYSRLHKTAGPNMKMLERYNRWKLQFGGLYATPAENDYRFKVFSNNAAKIDADNLVYAQKTLEEEGIVLDSPAFILQRHSDLTPEEFKRKYLGLDISRISSLVFDEAPELPDVAELPESHNLAQAAYQKKIRDQKTCGSCWAFSTVATLEKQYFDIYKQQVDLSQQDLVDCSKGDGGCDGGWPADTYWHVADNGIAFNSEYPYNNAKGTCKKTSNLASGRTTLGGQITSVTLDYNQDLAKKLSNLGVIGGLAIFAGGNFPNFDYRNNRIYDPSKLGECGENIDHAVNLAGAETGYTLIQNSWGTSWGDAGYARVKPCPGGLLGSPAYITHTYRKLPTA